MKAVFADTSFYLALLNDNDQYNAIARNVSALVTGRMMTTAWVLTEVADALSKPGHREIAAQFLSILRSDNRVLIEPADDDLFEQGLQLYTVRKDKHWSLTDCISFIVMDRYNLKDALSADHHFEQAGFVILMK